jgi:hypothetical protein
MWDTEGVVMTALWKRDSAVRIRGTPDQGDKKRGNRKQKIKVARGPARGVAAVAGARARQLKPPTSAALPYRRAQAHLDSAVPTIELPPSNGFIERARAPRLRRKPSQMRAPTKH